MYITFLEKFIALRYLRSRRAEGFISVSAWFSFLGIVLGVATLIVVMSVMNGFRTELIDRILGINGHLIIYPNEGNYIKNYNSKNLSALSSIYQAKGFTKYAIYSAIAYQITKNPKAGLVALNTNTAAVIGFNYIRFFKPALYELYKKNVKKSCEISELFCISTGTFTYFFKKN